MEKPKVIMLALVEAMLNLVHQAEGGLKTALSCWSSIYMASDIRWINKYMISQIFKYPVIKDKATQVFFCMSADRIKESFDDITDFLKSKSTMIISFRKNSFLGKGHFSCPLPRFSQRDTHAHTYVKCVQMNKISI